MLMALLILGSSVLVGMVEGGIFTLAAEDPLHKTFDNMLRGMIGSVAGTLFALLLPSDQKFLISFGLSWIGGLWGLATYWFVFKEKSNTARAFEGTKPSVHGAH